MYKRKISFVVIGLLTHRFLLSRSKVDSFRIGRWQSGTCIYKKHFRGSQNIVRGQKFEEKIMGLGWEISWGETLLFKLWFCFRKPIALWTPQDFAPLDTLIMKHEVFYHSPGIILTIHDHDLHMTFINFIFVSKWTLTIHLHNYLWLPWFTIILTCD